MSTSHRRPSSGSARRRGLRLPRVNRQNARRMALRCRRRVEIYAVSLPPSRAHCPPPPMPTSSGTGALSAMMCGCCRSPPARHSARSDARRSPNSDYRTVASSAPTPRPPEARVSRSPQMTILPTWHRSRRRRSPSPLRHVDARLLGIRRGTHRRIQPRWAGMGSTRAASLRRPPRPWRRRDDAVAAHTHRRRRRRRRLIRRIIRRRIRR